MEEDTEKQETKSPVPVFKKTDLNITKLAKVPLNILCLSSSLILLYSRNINEAYLIALDEPKIQSIHLKRPIQELANINKVLVAIDTDYKLVYKKKVFKRVLQIASVTVGICTLVERSKKIYFNVYAAPKFNKTYTTEVGACVCKFTKLLVKHSSSIQPNFVHALFSKCTSLEIVFACVGNNIVAVNNSDNSYAVKSVFNGGSLRVVDILMSESDCDRVIAVLDTGSIAIISFTPTGLLDSEIVYLPVTGPVCLLSNNTIIVATVDGLYVVLFKKRLQKTCCILKQKIPIKNVFDIKYKRSSNIVICNTVGNCVYTFQVEMDVVLHSQDEIEVLVPDSELSIRGLQRKILEVYKINDEINDLSEKENTYLESLVLATRGKEIGNAIRVRADVQSGLTDMSTNPWYFTFYLDVPFTLSNVLSNGMWNFQMSVHYNTSYKASRTIIISRHNLIKFKHHFKIVVPVMIKELVTSAVVNCRLISIAESLNSNNTVFASILHLEQVNIGDECSFLRVLDNGLNQTGVRNKNEKMLMITRKYSRGTDFSRTSHFRKASDKEFTFNIHIPANYNMGMLKRMLQPDLQDDNEHPAKKRFKAELSRPAALQAMSTDGTTVVIESENDFSTFNIRSTKVDLVHHAKDYLRKHMTPISTTCPMSRLMSLMNLQTSLQLMLNIWFESSADLTSLQEVKDRIRELTQL